MTEGAKVGHASDSRRREPRCRVLCVDDEPRVLESLKVVLRKEYEVLTATSGAEALAIHKSGGPIDIVLSDMRMPGMSGAVLLSRFRAVDPNVVRMLLTGQSDIESAAQAVNEGQVFRFLTKPCAPATLLACLQAGVQQRNLVLAERELLEKTLRGCVAAVIEVLALAQPNAFGRAVRIKNLVSRLAGRLGVEALWSLELAAMLSQLGTIALPVDVVERLQGRSALTAEDRALVDAVPSVARRLLADIPRLQAVDEILAFCGTSEPNAEGDGIPLGARILRAVLAYDSLESEGAQPVDAVAALRSRGGYDPLVLEALSATVCDESVRPQSHQLPLRSVQVGMVFLDDVFNKSGVLLIARGHAVTMALVERIRNFPPNHVPGVVRVALAPDKAS